MIPLPAALCDCPDTPEALRTCEHTDERTADDRERDVLDVEAEHPRWPS